ncbi:unnamed protein product, partial [Staurois parvus]
KPDSQDTLPGSTVCLKTTFKGTPPLSIRWFKGVDELKTGGSCYIAKENTSSSLELYAVKTSESGNYVCKVSNMAGAVECSANLFVKEPATFVEKLEPSQLFKKGDAVQLECKIAGTPTISITWFKNDKEIRESDACSVSFLNSVAALRIYSISLEDIG